MGGTQHGSFWYSRKGKLTKRRTWALERVSIWSMAIMSLSAGSAWPAERRHRGGRATVLRLELCRQHNTLCENTHDRHGQGNGSLMQHRGQFPLSPSMVFEANPGKNGRVLKRGSLSTLSANAWAQ